MLLVGTEEAAAWSAAAAESRQPWRITTKVSKPRAAFRTSLP
jgi:hypothetical protein